MLRARQISSMDVSPTIASLAIAGLISSTSSMRRYPGRNAASAIDHSPTAKPVVGGSRPWTCSSLDRGVQLLFGRLLEDEPDRGRAVRLLDRAGDEARFGAEEGGGGEEAGGGEGVGEELGDDERLAKLGEVGRWGVAWL